MHPWIERDVKNAQRCEADSMLQSFLLDCMIDDDQTMKDAARLFEECLRDVVPICNGDSKYEGSCEIKEHLQA